MSNRPLRALLSIPIALLAIASVGAGAATAATTITVTTTADIAAPCAPDSTSLRCAITTANASTGATTIAFSIPVDDGGCAGSPMVCTIAPTKALPAVRGSGTTIDGYTQPGSSVNTLALSGGDNARLVVRLDGSKAPAGTSGLVLGGSHETVRGLSITGFIVCFTCGPIPGQETGGAAVEVHGASDVVAGDFLGVLPDGVTAGPNQFAGVEVTGTMPSSAVIGGSDAASTNILSGNEQCSGGDCQGFGAFLDVTGTGTLLRRNLIGTTASGRGPLGNAATGVVVLGPQTVVRGNVISGSGGDGILSGAGGASFIGNLIGTDATGRAAIRNHSHGLDVQAAGNTVRANVISANGDGGLVLSGDHIVVQGNIIGTDITGKKALGNGFFPSAIFLGQPINGTDGIVLCAGSNTIGGAGPGQANLVSGNRGDGIFVGSGDDIVQGNLVGTDRSGSAIIANHAEGIGSRAVPLQGVGFCQQAPATSGGSNNTIGGTGTGEGNVVSGNFGAGIDLVGAQQDTIAGNRVGTDAQGTKALSNRAAGLALGATCDDNVCIPSSNDSVRGNLISGNGADGVDVSGTGGGTGISIAGNRIGTDGAGRPTLGNVGAGVVLENGASLDVVGGGASSEANAIAGNGGAGVLIGSSASDTGTHVVIEGNSTVANGGLGIDLAPAGVVDCSTPPPGPNGYTRCPVITSATIASARGTACGGCTVEVFLARPDAGDAGHGEGARLLARVLADGNGSWSVSIPAGMLASGDQVTATAITPPSTVPSQTSEFGANVTVS